MTSLVCSKCNNYLRDDDFYCSECGTKCENQVSPELEQVAGAQSASLTKEEIHASKLHIKNFKSTEYVYKVATFDSYMLAVLDDRRNEFAFKVSAKGSYVAIEKYLNTEIINLVDEFLNYYAIDGWEYWSTIDVPVTRIKEIADRSGDIESGSSMLMGALKTVGKEKLMAVGGGQFGALMPTLHTHYIFRKLKSH